MWSRIKRLTQRQSATISWSLGTCPGLAQIEREKEETFFVFFSAVARIKEGLLTGTTHFPSFQRIVEHSSSSPSSLPFTEFCNLTPPIWMSPQARDLTGTMTFGSLDAFFPLSTILWENTELGTLFFPEGFQRAFLLRFLALTFPGSSARKDRRMKELKKSVRQWTRRLANPLSLNFLVSCLFSLSLWV